MKESDRTEWAGCYHDRAEETFAVGTIRCVARFLYPRVVRHTLQAKTTSSTIITTSCLDLLLSLGTFSEINRNLPDRERVVRFVILQLGKLQGTINEQRADTQS